MPSERTPLMKGGVVPPSDASGDKPTVYFLERQKSEAIAKDAVEIETVPEGSTVEEFSPRPVSVTRGASSRQAASSRPGWFDFFSNIGKKSNAFSAIGGGAAGLDAFPRKAPVKIDPKVFFANERTFLAWMHVSVILAGASVAIVSFTDSHHSLTSQLYGIILLPVSIAFILYAMMQCKSKLFIWSGGGRGCVYVWLVVNMLCYSLYVCILRLRSLLCRLQKGQHDSQEGTGTVRGHCWPYCLDGYSYDIHYCAILDQALYVDVSWNINEIQDCLCMENGMLCN